MPWSTIINRDFTDFAANAWLRYGPNIDNYYMTDTMENLIKSGNLASDVPFLAGANEADLVAGIHFAHGITRQMPWRAEFCNADQFIYYWRHVPSGWANFGVGAYHGLELVYVFGYPQGFIAHHLTRTPGANYSALTGLTDAQINADPSSASYYLQIFQSTGYGAADAALSDSIMTMWTNFAKTGNPGAAGFTWPAYTGPAAAGSDAFVEIGAGGTFTAKTGVAATFGTP